MSSFADQFKAEIARIARKEMKAQVQPLKKAASQYRGEVAALKREIAALQVQLKRAQKASGRAEPSAATSDAPTEKLRFRAGGFATLRKKLGLSAEQMGKLIGVSALSVYHWEKGQTRPRASQLQAIAQVRGLGKRAALQRLAEQDAAAPAAPKPGRKPRTKAAEASPAASERPAPRKQRATRKPRLAPVDAPAAATSA